MGKLQKQIVALKGRTGTSVSVIVTAPFIYLNRETAQEFGMCGEAMVKVLGEMQVKSTTQMNQITQKRKLGKSYV